MVHRGAPFQERLCLYRNAAEAMQRWCPIALCSGNGRHCELAIGCSLLALS
jgi:hypothetical protein